MAWTPPAIGARGTWTRTFSAADVEAYAAITGDHNPLHFDPDFAARLLSRYRTEEALLLICRSGVRSHYAAELLAHAGYEGAYNVLEGFEGEYGAGTNGWRAAGLPCERG